MQHEFSGTCIFVHLQKRMLSLLDTMQKLLVRLYVQTHLLQLWSLVENLDRHLVHLSFQLRGNLSLLDLSKVMVSIFYWLRYFLTLI